MENWMKLIAATFPVGILIVLVIVFFRRCCSSKRRVDYTDTTMLRTESLRSGIEKNDLAYDEAKTHKRIANLNNQGGNYYIFRNGSPLKPLFNWADYPSLVSEAVEHGWSRFAFTGYNISSPSTRSMILGLCSNGDQGREREVEMSWEIFPTSVDFMQKIRLNSGLKKMNVGTFDFNASCVIKGALPLPGPPLGNSSFPQEAYFEITLLSSIEEEDKGKREKKKTGEGDRIKLIPEIGDRKLQSESLFHVNKMEESKVESKEEGKGEVVMLCMGLTGAGYVASKLPGGYPGSVGFNSNGSVYLDGIRLVSETEKAEWGRTDNVIGCGFDPGQKKVFFTLNSELIHVIYCKSEEFGSPLHPTLAANADVTILVNFGQSAFTYAPANACRTANPCFLNPLAGSPAATNMGYEDSRELFSMGNLDSHCLNRSTTKNHQNGDTISVGDESETDLFEIVLDKYNRSPSTAL